MQGYLHVYFGGKIGDLPIARGLALRAIGAGLNVGFFTYKDNIDKNLTNIFNNFNYDLVILEDCCQFDKDALLDFAKNRPQNVELVLTGKKFCEKILDMADLISEIRAWQRG